VELSTTITPLAPKEMGVPDTVTGEPPGVSTVPPTTTISIDPPDTLGTVCPGDGRDTSVSGVVVIPREGAAGATVESAVLLPIGLEGVTAEGFVVLLDAGSTEGVEPPGLEFGGSVGVGGRIVVEGRLGSITVTVLGANTILVGDSPWSGDGLVAGGIVT